MKIIYLSLFIWSILLSANELELELNPPYPVVNVNFYLTFKLTTNSDKTPKISFTPYNVQVLGKGTQGVSISTTVINGKITTRKEQSIVYELLGEKTGPAGVRNIKVEIDGKELSHADLNFNILSEPKRSPPVFMEADVSKRKAFVGEAIDVKYYIYFKTQIAANDIKEFPKLNKFIKRFQKVNSPAENVQKNGEVYRRILAYSARVYPEKPGQASIDPMTISIQMVEEDYSGNSFGFPSQRVKTKDFSSPRVEISVQALPTENVPKSFTGLVGEHEFKIVQNNNKYVVNEPVELRLEVQGPGALEKMEAPSLYDHQELESFDVKSSEVTDVSSDSTKKSFEYTYLPRAKLNLEEKLIALAYFDPNKMSYVEKKIKLSSLVVDGASDATTNKDSVDSKAISTKEDNSSLVSNTINLNDKWKNLWFKLFPSSKSVEPTLIAPVFDKSSAVKMNYVWNLYNAALLFVIFALLYSLFKSRGESFSSSHDEARALLKSMSKNGLNYKDLYQFVLLFNRGEESVYLSIQKLNVSIECKNYLKKSLEYCSQKSYGKNELSDEYKYEKKYFNEVMKHL